MGGLHPQLLIPYLRMVDPLKIDKIQLILSLQGIGSLQTEMVTTTLMTCDMTKPNTSCSLETKKNESLFEMPLMVTLIDGPTVLCLTNSAMPSHLLINKIRDCMNNFNTNFEGCLNVREASSSDSNYVEVLAGSGCWSYVGKQGGKQLLNLQPNGCMSCRTIMHEFMHAIGLFHMQSRPDRDDYVQIHFDNIQDGKEHNFNKCESCLTYDVPYDAKSFMHYKYYYFAKDSSKPTISSLSNDFTTQELGASSVLTESDILLLRRMYGCDENFSTTPPPCEKPSWKGDGYCDDINNVASCDYDGGDCCGDSVVTTYCETCECLDPAFATTTEAPAPACKDNWKAKKCQKRKNKGKCNKKKVKKNCQKTCEFCGKDETEMEENEFFDDLFDDDEYSYEMDEDEF